ncbi:hypothetical protein JZX87_10070 [Agrobacterium sp. Ap1]|uniref:hypothetical protein n=1 Tax=Agrobacterium sp. Ap1 TaxID=2815337 RepID=UPI001A8DE4D3|nr:hypothetical protein [Agrobacterium sp. Ap1]MBO0141508.1 hypothetical protein [Agrobacterium sp. Ap1]
MDFNTFDSRKASETPRALHLKHPGTGKLLYDDGDESKPCRVLVLGIEGETGQSAILQSQRERMKQDRSASEPTPVSDIHDALVKEISPLITGFENVNRGDKPAKAPDDVAWFLALQMIGGTRGQQSFAEQVRAFATDRAAILGNGSAS